ncbi:hypothetical protein [Clostridium sp.]|uniref:hypothetical protein n=1 Tax=Clostridium sp. TaxID=1506 RepID=UPI0034648979
MKHSISGVYGLEYVNYYENEVSSFVGIDSSVPSQADDEDELPMESMNLLKNLGFYRMIMKVSPDGLVAPEVDYNTREQIRMISLKNMVNSNIISKFENTKDDRIY